MKMITYPWLLCLVMLAILLALGEARHPVVPKHYTYSCPDTHSRHDCTLPPYLGGWTALFL